MADSGAFRGWPAEALEFYEGLAADNSRTYWRAHQDRYEREVRGPMLALLAELEPEFGAGRIFRPYRDVRFGRDKSPYKTSIAATLEHGGYVQLSASGLAAGNGMYAMDAGQLARYREAVTGPAGAELDGLLDRLRADGIEAGGHERLKTAPRGYPRDHPRIALLRYKGVVAWKEWPVAGWLGTRRALDRVLWFLRTSGPLHDWLLAHVGPPDAGADR